MGKQDSVKPDEREDFIGSGKCSDEITFVFDDGQKLYVSQNFLHYVSPVFKAMFEHDYEEKTTRTAKLSGKNLDDFLEFLLCLHPNKQKPVDRGNVLRIAPIAEEYQSAIVVERCKKAMINWLNERCSSDASNMANKARHYLEFLTLAVSLSYDEIENIAIENLAKLPYEYFTGMTDAFDDEYSESYLKNLVDYLSEYKTLFNSLDETLKNRILLSRLKTCDRHQKLSKQTLTPPRRI